MVGSFVKSIAGHDKNRIYIIIEETDKYYCVSDGIYHPIDRLKKKNKKHVQLIKKEITYRNNEDIRQLIRSYKEEIKCQKQM